MNMATVYVKWLKPYRVKPKMINACLTKCLQCMLNLSERVNYLLGVSQCVRLVVEQDSVYQELSAITHLTHRSDVTG